MRRGFLETRPQKAPVQFLSEMARSVSCLWTILVVLHSVSPLIQLSVVGPIYYLVMGNKLASGVLEAIVIGLRKQRKKNFNKVQVCLSY